MKIREDILSTLSMFGEGDRIKFVMSDGAKYYGTVTHKCINIDNYKNNIVLLTLYGPLYNQKVAQIYGYESLGYWPVYNNLYDLDKLLKHMQSCGCLISRA